MELVAMNEEVANRARGEVELTLKGKTLKMRPTHQFLAEIETLSGEGSMAILVRFLERRHGFNDVVNVIWCGLKASGIQLKRPKVSELVFETGLTLCAAPALELLVNAINYGEPLDEEGDDGQEGEETPDPD